MRALTMRVKLMAHWRQNLPALIEIQKTREYSHKTRKFSQNARGQTRVVAKNRVRVRRRRRVRVLRYVYYIFLFNPIELNFPGTGSSCICVAFSNLFLSLNNSGARDQRLPELPEVSKSD